MKIIINDKSINLIEAKSFSKRLIGLMFKKKKIDYAICFPRCASIHTFFMYQDIDVIMTDQNDIITEIYKGVKPWKIVRGIGYNTYEFAGNTIDENIKIGDKLKREV